MTLEQLLEETLDREIARLYMQSIWNLKEDDSDLHREIQLNLHINIKWFMELTNLIEQTFPIRELDTDKERQERLAALMGIYFSRMVDLHMAEQVKKFNFTADDLKMEEGGSV